MLGMAAVIITPAARADFDRLPLPIRPRVRTIFERLADWPSISGAKPLRGSLQGNYRIRTGDYRVIFFHAKSNDTITVTKIGYRGDIYD